MDYKKMLKKDLIIVLGKRDKKIKELEKKVVELESTINPLRVLSDKREDVLKGQFKIIDSFLKEHKGKKYTKKELIECLGITKQAFYMNKDLKEYYDKSINKA